MSEIFTCNIQKTFNKVINAGIYAPEIEYKFVHRWDETLKQNVEIDRFPVKNPAMCIALTVAYNERIISETQCSEVKKEINKWLEALEYEISYHTDNEDDAVADTLYLESALKMCGMKSDFEFRKSIYLNWDKRPNLALIYRQLMQAKYR